MIRWWARSGTPVIASLFACVRIHVIRSSVRTRVNEGHIDQVGPEDCGRLVVLLQYQQHAITISEHVDADRRPATRQPAQFYSPFPATGKERFAESEGSFGVLYRHLRASHGDWELPVGKKGADHPGGGHPESIQHQVYVRARALSTRKMLDETTRGMRQTRNRQDTLVGRQWESQEQVSRVAVRALAFVPFAPLRFVSPRLVASNFAELRDQWKINVDKYITLNRWWRLKRYREYAEECRNVQPSFSNKIVDSGVRDTCV